MNLKSSLIENIRRQITMIKIDGGTLIIKMDGKPEEGRDGESKSN